MKTDLNKQILEKIKREKIKPIPRWYFILKNSFFISLFLLSIFLGAISFSVIFYIFSDNQAVLENVFNLKYLKNGIFFWIFILGLFLILSTKYNRYFNNFYRYSFKFILFLNLSISFILGFVLFNFGLGKKTDILSSKYLDFYQKNIRITEIKKEIFLDKLKEIGLTKEIIQKNPELKELIKKKYEEEVLDKRYLLKNDCKIENIVCKKDEIKFKDSNGCGCKKIYK